KSSKNRNFSFEPDLVIEYLQIAPILAVASIAITASTQLGVYPTTRSSLQIPNWRNAAAHTRTCSYNLPYDMIASSRCSPVEIMAALSSRYLNKFSAKFNRLPINHRGILSISTPSSKIYQQICHGILSVKLPYVREYTVPTQ